MEKIGQIEARYANPLRNCLYEQCDLNPRIHTPNITGNGGNLRV